MTRLAVVLLALFFSNLILTNVYAAQDAQDKCEKLLRANDLACEDPSDSDHKLMKQCDSIFYDLQVESFGVTTNTAASVCERNAHDCKATCCKKSIALTLCHIQDIKQTMPEAQIQAEHSNPRDTSGINGID